MKLIRFLMRLCHETVTVELKNGVAITGTLTGVDISMNLHMKTVKVVNRDKSVSALETIAIRGNSIRDIILPDNLPLENLLMEEMTKSRAKRNESKAGPSRGRGRGMRRGRGGGGGLGRGRSRGGPLRK